MAFYSVERVPLHTSRLGSVPANTDASPPPPVQTVPQLSDFAVALGEALLLDLNMDDVTTIRPIMSEYILNGTFETLNAVDYTWGVTNSLFTFAESLKDEVPSVETLGLEVDQFVGLDQQARTAINQNSKLGGLTAADVAQLKQVDGLAVSALNVVTANKGQMNPIDGPVLQDAAYVAQLEENIIGDPDIVAAGSRLQDEIVGLESGNGGNNGAPGKNPTRVPVDVVIGGAAVLVLGIVAMAVFKN